MRKQNSVAFFNILSMVLLNGLAIFTGPLFTRLLGTAIPSHKAGLTNDAD